MDTQLEREAILIDTVRLIKAKAAEYSVNPHYIQRIEIRAKNSSTREEMRLETKARYEIMLELLSLGYDKDLIAGAFKIARVTLNNIILKHNARRI